MRFYFFLCFFFVFKEDSDIEKFKEMAKIVCKIEHDCLIGCDVAKHASKLSSIEAFNQVDRIFKLETIKCIIYARTFPILKQTFLDFGKLHE